MEVVLGRLGRPLRLSELKLPLHSRLPPPDSMLPACICMSNRSPQILLPRDMMGVAIPTTEAHIHLRYQ